MWADFTAVVGGLVPKNRRWQFVVLLVALAIAGAYLLDWTGWLLSWIGTAFKLLSGAVLMWWVDRHVQGRDLSVIAEQYPGDDPASKAARARAVGSAAVGRAIMVAAGALGMAIGT